MIEFLVGAVLLTVAWFSTKLMMSVLSAFSWIFWGIALWVGLNCMGILVGFKLSLMLALLCQLLVK